MDFGCRAVWPVSGCVFAVSARQAGAQAIGRAFMPTNVVVVGVQWGDEGKGKVVDALAERFDVVARYQGGANAGHTVVLGGRKFIFQLLPCEV